MPELLIKFKKLFSLFLFCLIFLSGMNKASFSFEEDYILDKSYLEKKINQQYILGEGDVIKISISKFIKGGKNIYKIDGEGTITMDDIGNIFISGLTTRELEKVLSDKYKEIVYTSNVKVEVIQYRTIKVNIQGEVNQPGLTTLEGSGDFNKFSFSKNNKFDTLMNNQEIDDIKVRANNFPTLYDALREAGGITMYSDLEKIEVIRKNAISKGGGLIKAKINFLDFINNINTTSNIRIYDDDIIVIPKGEKIKPEIVRKAMLTSMNPKYIEVFVTGRVENSGKLTLSKTSTLNDAIEFAGGQKIISGQARLARIKGDGTVEKRLIRYKKSNKRGSFTNPYLMEGDVIIVGKSKFNIVSDVINELTSPISGIVNSYYLYKIFE